MLKPFNLFSNITDYSIRTNKYLLKKYIGNFKVTIYYPYNGTYSEKQIPRSQLIFVIFYQLTHRPYETLWVNNKLVNRGYGNGELPDTIINN